MPESLISAESFTQQEEQKAGAEYRGGGILDTPVKVSFKSKLEAPWFCLLKPVVKKRGTSV